MEQPIKSGRHKNRLHLIRNAGKIWYLLDQWRTIDEVANELDVCYKSAIRWIWGMEQAGWPIEVRGTGHGSDRMYYRRMKR